MPELPVLKGVLDDLYILLAKETIAYPWHYFYTVCIHIKLAYGW